VYVPFAGISYIRDMLRFTTSPIDVIYAELHEEKE
jgi:hypothetical protein